MNPDDIIKILVVDDDPETADLYKQLLEKKMAVEIEQAQDAQTARRKLSDSRYDVVTINYQLPDDSGLVLLEDIVEGEDNPPAIVVTEQGDVHLATRSFEMGAAGYVIKDYTLPKTFAGVVENALAKAALKRATEALNRENAFTTVAVNVLEDVFLVIDLEGRLLSWNRRLKELTGFTDSELHLMDSAEIFTRDDSRRLLHEVKNIGKGEKTSVRLRITASDGRRIPYELTAVMLKDADGTDVGLCAIGREVAWSQKVQRAILAREMTGHEVVELTGEIIARVDYDGMFMYLNDAACAFWGKTKDELIGRSFTEFVHPDDVGRSLEASTFALHKRRMIKGFINRQMTPLGWRFVEWNAIPVLGDEESFIGFQFTGRDITEKVQAEQFLMQVNRELDAYAHTISHDLKGPLSTIMLASETLRMLLDSKEASAHSDGTLQEMARIITRYTEQAGTLVENLLVLAESGQVPTEVEDVDVRDLVESVLDRLSNQVIEKNVTVSVSEDLGRITGNRVQISQIFTNLIENAIIHNDNPEPQVEVTYLGMEEDYHRYVVRDNGSGVEDEDAENIFKLFYRREGGGAGIGLATVEKIVKVYDDFLRVYNDEGACFEFCLKDIRQESTADADGNTTAEGDTDSAPLK